jgi:hypothetical protein
MRKVSLLSANGDLRKQKQKLHFISLYSLSKVFKSDLKIALHF